MLNLKGKWVLITGASRNYPLYLWHRRAAI